MLWRLSTGAFNRVDCEALTEMEGSEKAVVRGQCRRREEPINLNDVVGAPRPKFSCPACMLPHGIPVVRCLVSNYDIAM